MHTATAVAAVWKRAHDREHQRHKKENRHRGVILSGHDLLLNIVGRSLETILELNRRVCFHGDVTGDDRL